VLRNEPASKSRRRGGLLFSTVNVEKKREGGSEEGGERKCGSPNANTGTIGILRSFPAKGLQETVEGRGGITPSTLLKGAANVQRPGARKRKMPASSRREEVAASADQSSSKQLRRKEKRPLEGKKKNSTSL